MNIEVIKRRKAIKRCPITVKESSILITVRAPKEPCKITKKSSNEYLVGNNEGKYFLQNIDRRNSERIKIPTRNASNL